MLGAVHTGFQHQFHCHQNSFKAMGRNSGKHFGHDPITQMPFASPQGGGEHGERGRHEEADVREVIKLKAVYELLETITDKCEDVANVIEGVILENA